jgi:hypothetical protein
MKVIFFEAALVASDFMHKTIQNIRYLNAGINIYNAASGKEPADKITKTLFTEYPSIERTWNIANSYSLFNFVSGVPNSLLKISNSSSWFVAMPFGASLAGTFIYKQLQRVNDVERNELELKASLFKALDICYKKSESKAPKAENSKASEEHKLALESAAQEGKGGTEDISSNTESSGIRHRHPSLASASTIKSSQQILNSSSKPQDKSFIVKLNQWVNDFSNSAIWKQVKSSSKKFEAPLNKLIGDFIQTSAWKQVELLSKKLSDQVDSLYQTKPWQVITSVYDKSVDKIMDAFYVEDKKLGKIAADSATKKYLPFILIVPAISLMAAIYSSGLVAAIGGLFSTNILDYSTLINLGLMMPSFAIGDNKHLKTVDNQIMNSIASLSGQGVKIDSNISVEDLEKRVLSVASENVRETYEKCAKPSYVEQGKNFVSQYVKDIIIGSTIVKRESLQLQHPLAKLVEQQFSTVQQSDRSR